MPENSKKDEVAATGTSVPIVKWDDTAMSTTYANVCNVTSTREEVTLLVGTNQTLPTEVQEVTVKLTNRIIMNPFAAKRLQKLLENVLGQYEARFGKLKIGVAGE